MYSRRLIGVRAIRLDMTTVPMVIIGSMATFVAYVSGFILALTLCFLILAFFYPRVGNQI